MKQVEEVEFRAKQIAVFTKSSFKFNDVREKLLPFLDEESEKIVLNKLSLTSTHSFERLLESNLEFVSSHLSNLVYHDKCGLLANFKTETRKTFINMMPELVKERLNQESFEIQESSLYLKAILYKELTDLELTEVTPLIGLDNHAA